MQTVPSRRFQFKPELWVQRVTGRITVLMDLECTVRPGRITEQQCSAKVVIACREEFGPAGAHSPPYLRFSKLQYWTRLLQSLGSLVHSGLSSQDTIWTPDGHHEAFSASCVAHLQVITDLTASQILETFLSQTGIVMDLVCPLRQLLWTRHAVARTIVPMCVTRALRAESDGKSDQIQSQL